MKKILSLLLAFMLILSMTTVAFASGNTESVTIPTNGTITISNVSVKPNGTGYEIPSTYKAYQMLKLESYNVNEGKYNYIVNTEWSDFFEQETVKAYFIKNANGYIEWSAIEGEDLEARAIEVAALALAYVESKSLAGIFCALAANVIFGFSFIFSDG